MVSDLAHRGLKIAAALILAGVAVAAVPLARWQAESSALERCQSNERRLGTALLLYQQDHDACLPPTTFGAPTGSRSWLQVLRPYYGQDDITHCPVRSVGAGAPDYALNRRFCGYFSHGAYPLDNLELPAQTALIVESRGAHAVDWYWDTAGAADRYPSVHGGRMNVVAADGHAVTLKLAHYGPDGHDPIYGRLGGSVFNWNGGHPNGETASPPRE